MALIPVDVALSGINTIRGLFGASQADKERERQIAEAKRQLNLAIAKATENTNNTLLEFQRMEQAGEFDATKTLDLIGRMSRENLGVGVGNLDVKFGEYKPGDTPKEMARNVMTSDALLREQAQRLAAQDQFYNKRQQALGYLNQVRAQEAQTRLGLGGQMMNTGLSMPGNNVTNTIAGLASQYQQMLDKQKKEQEAKQQKEARNKVSTTQPQTTYAPGSLAAGLEQFKNIQLSGVPNPFGR
jgi:hypothetical protein